MFGFKAMLNKPYVEYKEKMSVLTPNLPTSDTETAVDTSPLVSLTAGKNLIQDVCFLSKYEILLLDSC